MSGTCELVVMYWSDRLFVSTNIEQRVAIAAKDEEERYSTCASLFPGRVVLFAGC